MKKFLRALSSTPSIVAAGTAGLLAVALHSWPIAALGAATCAALAAADATKKKKKALPDSALAAQTRFDDPQTANAVRAILAARAELERAITSADTVATMLAPVADLEIRAAKLAGRAQDIADHLKRTNIEALKREIHELEARGSSTADDKTRASYAAALEARAGHLETLNELARTKERIGATLLSIAATLDALPAKIVRLRGIDDATSDVGRDLTQMNEEIASFEETLLHIHGVS